MGLYDKTRDRLAELTKAKYGNGSTLAAELGFNQTKTTGFLNKTSSSVPKSDFVFRLLEEFDAEILFPDDVSKTEKSLSFSPPEILDTQETTVAPDQYRAIPVTQPEHAAMPGVIPEKKITGWCLLWKTYQHCLIVLTSYVSRLAQEIGAWPPHSRRVTI